jgi:hypothetical protein
LTEVADDHKLPVAHQRYHQHVENYLTKRTIYRILPNYIIRKYSEGAQADGE